MHLLVLALAITLPVSTFSAEGSLFLMLLLLTITVCYAKMVVYQINVERLNDMSKSTKTESALKSKSNKGANFVHFVIASGVIVVLTSSAYTAFITAVGVGGKTNIYLASPSIVAIAGIISAAVYKAVASFNK